MRIELTPDAARWIEAEVASGTFPSPEEAVQQAIDRLCLAALKVKLEAAVAEGGRNAGTFLWSGADRSPRLSRQRASRLGRDGGAIEESSGSREAALDLAAKLTLDCERTAALPGLLGRSRQDLLPDCPSLVLGRYLIFVRYIDDVGQRDFMEVIHVLWGSRDVDAFFRRAYGEA